MSVRRLSALILLPVVLGCPSGSDEFANCAGVVPYTVGATVAATVGNDQCAGPGDIEGHLYSLTLATQTNFALTMTPSGFNGVLALYTGAGDLVWSAADVGVLSFKLYLPAGNYSIVAGKHQSGGGSYTLTSPVASQDACLPHGMVVIGTSAQGTLTTADCPGGTAGWYNDVYAIRLKAGQHVTFNTTVDQAVRTELYTGAGSDLIDGKNLNAAGTTSTVYTAPSAGMYRMHIASNAVPANYTFVVAP